MSGETREDRQKEQICAGLLAHVDAGKTTLSEAILYESGSIRKLGRVDRRDSFLDTEPLERERGITIFAKQAGFQLGDREYSLLDTPGHADFSAEMERTLQVLDYGILVINGADGVQGHTETLWRLLRRYRIPVFLFVNKMDQEGTDRKQLMAELKKRLSSRCVDFSGLPPETEGSSPGETMEEIAMNDEAMLEKYLETEEITQDEISSMIEKRKIFPCYFGSALKLTGIQEFLKGFSAYTRPKQYPEAFGAKVYKIGRDERGNRLTFLKVTGGSLKVKMEIGGEKVDQIRVYSGREYRTLQEAGAGAVCAVLGLSGTRPGMGLGGEPASEPPMLEPVLSYRVDLPAGTDVHEAYLKLRSLEEEEPELQLLWQEQLNEIHVKLMGEVQTEILGRLIRDRFGMEAGFSEGQIVYRETIGEPVVGIGHFEPLRHYAEVHLLLEPLPRGSGLIYASGVSEEELALNYQRLVISQLSGEEHPGVLCGAPITDMRITLIAGKSHLKHTEGGDFRQAAFRALRQGLMQGQSILLEPYYSFRIELPSEMAGRAMTDIQRMGGSFQPPEQEGGDTVLQGEAPVSGMRGYQRELSAYSKGYGRLSLSLAGYRECREPEEVIKGIGYDPERDTEHPAGSIFCSHGAGVYVDWREVPAKAHIQERFTEAEDPSEESLPAPGDGEKTGTSSAGAGGYGGSYAEDRELEAIFERTFGPVKREKKLPPGRSILDPARNRQLNLPARESWLLVDGYNIIHAWDELRELAELSFDAARIRLLDILCNYQGFRKCRVIVVFDAYKVAGRYTSEVERYQNIFVVYTKQAETADQYIAKAVQEISGEYNVTVATSDRLVQLIILGQGALRLSARELYEEVEGARAEMRRDYLTGPRPRDQFVLKDLPEGYGRPEEKEEKQQD